MREQVDRSATAPSRLRLIATLGLGLGLIAASPARPAWAQWSFDNTDATIDIPITGSFYITGSSHVQIIPGGEIIGSLVVDRSSTVTLNGGVVDGSVTASGGSTITVLIGGIIGDGLIANETSTVDISGGTVISTSGDGVVVNGGAATISGGGISSSAYKGNGVTVKSGTASISGGDIFSGDLGYGVYISGGTVNVSGGARITGLSGVVVDGGTGSITGGSFHDISGIGVLVQSGTVSISGGSIAGRYRDAAAYGTGTADVFGCNLVLAGRTLTGTLEDGTNINMQFDSPTLHNHLPQIIRPAKVTVPTDPNLCTATVNPGTATVTGSDCGSIPTLMGGARSDGLGLTAPYPLGITTITWTATDSFGQQNQVQQTVTVLDAQKPALALPVSQTVNPTSLAGAPVSFTVAATDNCGTPSVVCKDQNGQTVTSGMTFPIGTTVVTCTATDGSGNQTSGSFSITVLPPADLAINLAGSPMPVKNKQNLTYTLTVSNAGPATATNVVISDPLPADTTFVGATASTGLTLSKPTVGANGTLVGNLASLAPGGSATVTLTVAVNTKKTAISNTASVSASTPDTVTSNNTATLAVAVK